MERVIYKYQALLADEVIVEVHRNAEVIHIDDQGGHGGKLEFWALVPVADVDETERRRYQVRGTGMQAPVGLPHVTTVVTAGGRLVWHVFGPEADRDRESVR